jgi:hypothetical protein
MEGYRLAYDVDPENPNPHAFVLDSRIFSTEEEARTEGAAREAEERVDYGESFTGWLVLKEENV